MVGGRDGLCFFEGKEQIAEEQLNLQDDDAGDVEA